MVGLGNPGSKYTNTRHNVGFMSLERYAKKKSVEFKERKKVFSYLAEIGVGSDSLKLLMPKTFMNESGLAIRAAMDWFGLEANQLLVVVDDMDLPLGQLRIRIKGGSGGHNGLKSTIQHLGTQNFCRLRIGIGAPSNFPEERKAKTISHVLGAFNSKEVSIIDQVLNEVSLGVDLIREVGFEKASNYINSYKSEC